MKTTEDFNDWHAKKMQDPKFKEAVARLERELQKEGDFVFRDAIEGREGAPYHLARCQEGCRLEQAALETIRIMIIR